MPSLDNGTFCGDKRAWLLCLLFTALYLLGGGKPSRWERNHRHRAGLD